MQKEFIPYQPSLELKELGFDEPCFSYYKNDQLSDILEEVINSKMRNVNNEIDDYISAPTFSQAFRWFREKYGYDIHIKGTHFRASYVIGIPKEINMKSIDGYPLVTSWDYIIDETGKRNTYEEAELTCLIKLIEIAKTK